MNELLDIAIAFSPSPVARKQAPLQRNCFTSVLWHRENQTVRSI